MWISSPLKAVSNPCEPTRHESNALSRSLSRVAQTAWQLLVWATHSFVKVHVVGENLDVRMENARLEDDLFQNVSDAGGEDEQRDAVLVQVVEEELVALPVREPTLVFTLVQLDLL